MLNVLSFEVSPTESINIALLPIAGRQTLRGLAREHFASMKYRARIYVFYKGQGRREISMENSEGCSGVTDKLGNLSLQTNIKYPSDVRAVIVGLEFPEVNIFPRSFFLIQSKETARRLTNEEEKTWLGPAAFDLKAEPVMNEIQEN